MTTATLPAAASLEVRAIGTLNPSPTNPRKFYDPAALKELAASIAAKGVEQPLVVRHRGDGQLELVHGERRLKAAKLAGLEAVPVILRELSDAQVVEAQLAEMGQARDVSPLEKAHAFQAYMRSARLTQQQLAGRLGLSEPVVSETLALLELPEAARVLFHDPRMTASHGRELLRLVHLPARFRRLVHDVGSALKGDGVYAAKRLRAEVVRELASEEAQQRWLAEEKRGAEQAKREAAAGKPREGKTLTPAALKERRARAQAAELGRQRHLEVVARAPAIAAAAVREARAYRVPDAALMALARALTVSTLPAGVWGTRHLTADTLAHLGPAAVAKLPGKWRRPQGGEVTPRPTWALDARAARAWVGLWAWLAFRSRGLEASLDAGARKRLAVIAARKLGKGAPRPKPGKQAAR